MTDAAVKVPSSGSTSVDAESLVTEAGPVNRQRISISGDVANRIAITLERLLAEQRLTNALLKEEFRSDLTLESVRRP